MKKLLAILLVLVMVFGMVACTADNDEDDVRGEVASNKDKDDKDDKADKTDKDEADKTDKSDKVDQNEDKDNAEGPSEKEFDIGKLVANKYTNSFAGISCELSSDWKVLTEAEIRQVNETTIDILGDNYEEALRNANVFTDMMATHVNGMDTVNVTFEKLTGVNLALTEEQYVELSKDFTKSGLEAAGMTNVVVTTGEAAFAGADHVCITISAQFNGIAVYERIAVVKCQNYMVLIAACTWQTDTCKTVLDMFKAI